MISIIVPVYNVKQYLAQCIESVLAQSVRDFELILVDDGSSDASGIICDEYAKQDERIISIHQQNAGVSMARNRGLDVATGEWITFIDSDDWVDEDYLESFHLEKDDSDVVVQGLKFYDNRKDIYFEYIRVADCVVEDPDFKKKVSDNKLLNWGYPVAKAYRKSLVDHGARFDPSISYHEDHIFVLNIYALAQKIRLVESVSYNYRYFHSSNSLSIKHHSWQKMNIAGNGMIEALNKMRDRFLVPDSKYERIIYNFAYRPKINAVCEVFGLNESIHDKRKTIHAVLKIEEVLKYYRPYSYKDRLVKFILCYTPFMVQYIFFFFFTKHQKRNR